MNYHRRHKYDLDFRTKILNKIIEYITAAVEKSKQEKVNEIALQHRERTGSVAGFRFRKKGYRHQLVSDPCFKLKPLHPGLVDSFLPHLEDWERHEGRQHEVRNFLIHILNIMGNINDLYNLLPECLHSVLPDCDAEIGTLSEERVKQFTEEYRQSIQQIKVQIVMQTLKA